MGRQWVSAGFEGRGTVYRQEEAGAPPVGKGLKKGMSRHLGDADLPGSWGCVGRTGVWRTRAEDKQDSHGDLKTLLRTWALGLALQGI